MSNLEDEKIVNKIVNFTNKINQLKQQENWIQDSFEFLLDEFDLREEKPLSYFFPPNNPNITEAYGIEILNTEKCDKELKGLIRNYKIKLEKNFLIIFSRFKDELIYRKVIKIYFENKKIRDFFYLSLKKNEETKRYRNEKNVLETTLNEMKLKVSESEDSVKKIQNLMDLLENEYKKKLKRY